MNLRAAVEGLWDEAYQNGPAPTEAELAVDEMLQRVLALIPEGGAWVTEESLARALPGVLTPEECEKLYGPGHDPLDIADEWYATPRNLAAAILERLREGQP